MFHVVETNIYVGIGRNGNLMIDMSEMGIVINASNLNEISENILHRMLEVSQRRGKNISAFLCIWSGLIIWRREGEYKFHCFRVTESHRTDRRANGFHE